MILSFSVRLLLESWLLYTLFRISLRTTVNLFPTQTYPSFHWDKNWGLCSRHWPHPWSMWEDRINNIKPLISQCCLFVCMSILWLVSDVSKKICFSVKNRTFINLRRGFRHVRYRTTTIWFVSRNYRTHQSIHYLVQGERNTQVWSRPDRVKHCMHQDWFS